MRILVVHNTYQKPGGEDVVFAAEAALLEAHGHEVVRFTAANDEIRSANLSTVAAKTIWNRTAMRQVRALIQRTRPHVMHAHNTFPLISPSIYSAARMERVPVVQTLHNFRLICPNALLRRNGMICEDCLGSFTRWPGVVHGCYRDHRGATGVVAAMLATHTLLGTWTDKVDRYIAMSEFARAKFVQGGYPAEKIIVKPNFLDRDPGLRASPRGYVLFVGRLSPEKGLNTLLNAVRRITPPPRLKIAGQGPLLPAQPDVDPNVEWLGHRNREQTFELMKGASVLVMPSEWYEGCPLTLIEAFAIGVPVIASRLGTMAEMITDGVTGLHFSPVDDEGLARAIEWALTHPDQMTAMACRARECFEREYTAERNYQQLMSIYHGVMH